MSDATAASVKEFFDSYRAAFERSDAPAIASHFACPGHITSDTGETILLVPVNAEEEWNAKAEQLLAMYKAVGVTSAHVRESTVTELSPQLVQAVIHWVLRDVAGGSLYEFDAAYTLAQVNGALRISAISHNEVPRYRAYLARVQARPEPLPKSPRADVRGEA